MTAFSDARVACVVLAILASGCEIAQDDLLPGFGAPCSVDEALCPIEHVCKPDKPGKSGGLCEPVLDFGKCPKPTHPPGRIGEVKDGDVNLDEKADQPKMDDVRLVKGSLRVQHEGSQLELNGVCNFRALQEVGDSLIISNTNLETLDGLQSLTRVVNGIAIVENNRLKSLEGLANLVSVETCTFRGGDFSGSVQVMITRNDQLPASEIDAFVDELNTRAGGDVDVIRCGNGPVTDRDGLCAGTAEFASNAVHDGDALCQ